jgi:hypothetical protein
MSVTGVVAVLLMPGLHACNPLAADGRSCYMKDSDSTDRNFRAASLPKKKCICGEERLDGSAPVHERGKLLDRSVRLVGRANQWRGFIQNDRHRHIQQHFFEVPFVLKGVKERAVLHFG